MKYLPATIAALACLICSSPIYAEDKAALISEQAQALYDNVMSPYCPGRLLRDCPSGAAGDLKDKIAMDLASGQSPEDIMQGLIAQYGSEVRATPTDGGFGIVAWWLPIVFIFAGVLVILSWLGMHRWIEKKELPPGLDAEMLERIERELK